MHSVFTLTNKRKIIHGSFYSTVLLMWGIMITHRESYVFDPECKFCAHDKEHLVSDVNTKICPDCYTWISNSVGLINLGIMPASE